MLIDNSTQMHGVLGVVGHCETVVTFVTYQRDLILCQPFGLTGSETAEFELSLLTFHSELAGRDA